MLINQFRILAQLEKEGENGEYTVKAEILENGYTGLYDTVFEHLSDEQPRELVEETHQILSMFRGLNNAVAHLNEDERKQFNFTFEGFDGNNDPHFHIATFLIKRLGLYNEINVNNINSHDMTTISEYRRMLALYNSLGVGYGHLTFEQLQKIAG